MRIAVLGPTAVGKTEFAIALAHRLGGEIVSADAVQVYRGLDRGSAKPALAERGGVAHHLIDVADPEMELSVAVYQSLAQDAMREIERRGKVAIVTGGSGLYLRAALGEWHAFGARPDPAVRAWARGASSEEIFRRALQADPDAARRLSAQDRPRLVRVIERAAAAGTQEREPAAPPCFKIGLMRPRAELYARIDARSALLLAHLIEETARLMQRGPAATALAERTVGYREAAEVLRGEISEREALSLLQRDTRRLAKRQMTWWRREKGTVWVRPEQGLGQLLPSLSMLKEVR